MRYNIKYKKNSTGTVPIETDNLLLRRFTIKDAEPMFKNWASDPEVTRFLTWTPHKDPDETKLIISKWLEEYERPNAYQWAIELKSVGEPIGSIGVVRTKEETKTAEIGYCIGKAFWHKGYTSEALTAVIRFLFNRTDYNSLAARHDVRNPNSGKVMLRCGMKYEGTLPEVTVSGFEEKITLYVYSISRSEWESDL